VKRLIRKAHERGIRVIAELVINHTSDQHPWFQRARRAKPGSAMRDFYVWSETGKEYAGTRIIFLDTERSNWAVELDLSEYGGRIPIELNNGSPFPPIGQLTYLLTMSPYGFYWFLLATEGDWPSWHTPAPEPRPEFHTIVLRGSLQDALLGAVRPTLEHEVLRPYLGKRRWYSAKNQTLQEVRLTYLAPFVEGDCECHICELETITSGGTATWLLPLAVIWDTERAAALATQLALSRVRRERRIGLLTDAFAVPAFAIELVRRMRLAQRIATSQGDICFVPTPGLVGQLEISDDAEINWISAEQSNSSLIIADQIMLKIFRRISGGKHPEAEMSRYLTAQGFTNSPPLLGEIVRVAPDGTTYSLAVVQGFVRN
jgi:maltose alpha-D-glucosyltransferase / alpha-amylase